MWKCAVATSENCIKCVRRSRYGGQGWGKPATTKNGKQTEAAVVFYVLEYLDDCFVRHPTELFISK